MVRCPVCDDRQLVHVSGPASTSCLSCGARWVQTGIEQSSVAPSAPSSGDSATHATARAGEDAAAEPRHDRGVFLDQIAHAVDEERARFAAELHDGPIQRVTGLGMRLYVGVRQLRSGDYGAAAGTLGEVQEGLHAEVGALRALMTQLRPPVLSERGLVGALRDHAASSESGATVVVEGSVEERLSPEVELGLYRIAQEALANARRHSRARRIEVAVASLGHRIRLTVHDDGVGFDVSTKVGHTGGRHFGLLAMRERAASMRGSLAVRSAPGAGTTVTVDVPGGTRP